MTRLLVVCHPEDVVTEFLSVLADPAPLRLAVVADGTVVDLPPGGLDARLPCVVELMGRATGDEPTAGHVPAGGNGPVWTHCPADERLDRAKVGVWAAQGRAVTRCSTGVCPHLRFVADHLTGLTRAQVAAKLDVLGAHAAPLVERAGGPRGIGIAAVADVERYVDTTPAQAARLFALRHDWHPDVDLGAEPWDFAASPYERGRLRATAGWVARHARAGARLAELGSCEGALTELLLADGFTVDAFEPVAAFADRFAARAHATWPGRVTTGTATIAELAAAGGPRADAYLLIEMLNYVADPAVCDGLATDVLFIAMSPFAVRTRVVPWLRDNPVWAAVEVTPLAAPRFELVCDGLAYHRKLGSAGVLARRRR
ncbi:hypothetical protein [Spirilliplanes yamanashiensis]|uniref:Nodulation protein S (NodS) n=1 Tax=Spirilliplanes yamanashiensis TaxID=42233 RepID=A0A8J3Y3T6_9ACTN|nr:hypothetical protein [Spirilliplanes yamanashiensis]MDP9819995.1 hypothetical protein [Spirilliplanes yamanashiensis]GIJ01186.1 hypothetical protein Sya03_05380 [Spirilliplanes yamanashiensis]